MNILNDTPSTDSTSTEPIRFCPVCGERTAVILQPDYRKGATGPLVMSTCVEPSCCLYLQTISDNADLSVYHAIGVFDSMTGVALNG